MTISQNMAHVSSATHRDKSISTTTTTTTTTTPSTTPFFSASTAPSSRRSNRNKPPPKQPCLSRFLCLSSTLAFLFAFLYFGGAYLTSSTRSVENVNYIPTMTLSDLVDLKDIDGNSIDSAALFKGKVVFAMNVASACGYTKPGYNLLKRLTDKFDASDFVAVAIPCNSFLNQENGSPEDIKVFALSKAQKLVVLEKSTVNGDNPHPIVALAKQKFPGRVEWNFDGRFVFGRDGLPTARFGNSASGDEIEAAIEKLI